MKNSNTLNYDDETVVWEGSPSQWVNSGKFLWWLAVLISSVGFQISWSKGLINPSLISPVLNNPILSDVVNWVAFGLATLSILMMLYAYLSVRSEHTTITRNKIKESKGITSIFRKELYCELSDVNDIKSPPAGLMGLVGLSTLVLVTQDNDQAVISIRGIRNRDVLINKIQPLWRKLKIDRKGYF